MFFSKKPLQGVDVGSHRISDRDFVEGGLLTIGGMGTGKSATTKIALRSLLERIKAGDKLRLVIIDSDSTYTSLPYAVLGPEFLEKNPILMYTNPLDRRGQAWDFCTDYADTDFFDFANAIHPAIRTHDPFWDSATHSLIAVVARTLLDLDWLDARTLVHILRNKQFIRYFLRLHSPLEYEAHKPHFGKGRLGDGVFATVSTAATKYRTVAACYDTPGIQQFSITEFLSLDQAILVLPYRPEHKTTLEPFIAAIIKRIIELTFAKRDRTIPVFMAIDELRLIGAWLSSKSSDDLQQARYFGRASGLGFMGSVQTTPGTHQALGREKAIELLGLFGTKMMFHTDCPDTAEWMSVQIGDEEVYEGITWFQDGCPVRKTRRILPKEVFRNIPCPQHDFDDLHCLVQAHNIGVFPATYSHTESTMAIAAGPKTSSFAPRPRSDMVLRPLDDDELRYLMGLERKLDDGVWKYRLIRGNTESEKENDDNSDHSPTEDNEPVAIP